MRPSFKDAIVVAFVAFVASATPVRAQTPDMLLVNGKIVTVDDRFTVAQALAIRGDRILRSAPRPRSRR